MLKEMTIDFFKNLYKYVGPCNFDPILQQCLVLVMEEMNYKLVAEISLEKV